MKESEKMTFRQSICISPELEKQISIAAEKLDMAKQDAIRLMLRIGLKHLESVKYDIAQSVLSQAKK